MKDSLNITKFLKYVGNILVIISILILINKFLIINISLESFYSKKFILCLFLAVTVQTFLLICSFYPWKNFIEILSEIKLPTIKTIDVFVASNIYKYIPGNVLQYIGRNKLALDLKISHLNVALSTFIDMIFSVIFIFLISVILLRSIVFNLIHEFLDINSLAIYISIFLLISILIIIFIFFNKNLFNYVKCLGKFFEPQNLLKLLFAILYYCFNAFLYLFVYYIILKVLIGEIANMDDLVLLTGAFGFSWVVGTITPGAPGGVGIREAMMMYISDSRFTEELLIFIVLMRIATTLADIFAYVIGSFILPRLFKSN